MSAQRAFSARLLPAEPLLDAGMASVIERHFGPRALADIRDDPYLQRLSRRLIRSRRPIEVNWALLDLAALVCKSAKPHCDRCPVGVSLRYAAQRRLSQMRARGGRIIAGLLAPRDAASSSRGKLQLLYKHLKPRIGPHFVEPRVDIEKRQVRRMVVVRLRKLHQRCVLVAQRQME